MIVKNEEKHIARVLENTHIFADEIIVLDTGSTDRTIEIAIEFGATIQHFQWCQDFAKARNASLSYCTKDFILWLDADDLLTLDDAIRIKKLLLEDIKWDILYLPYYYNYNPDNPGHGKRKKTPRIFRNNIGITWKSPIHEYLIYPSTANKKDRTINDIVIYHYPLRESHANALRNLDIMHKAATDPDNLGSSYHFWHIAKEYSGLGNQRLAIKYYKLALQQGYLDNPLVRARQYYGLGRQYKRMQEYPSAIEAHALSAINYPHWREPFVAIAECYYELADYKIALTYLQIAEKIPRHEFQIERAELYEDSIIKKLNAKIMSYLLGIENISVNNQSNKIYKLLAGGDACLGRQMPDYITQLGVKRPFEKIHKLTNEADIFLINLECVISSVGHFNYVGGKRPFYYRANPIVINALVASGINAVMTANNHSLDYGEKALSEQKELLYSCNIANPGSGNTIEEAASACFIEIDDVIVAIISIDSENNKLKANVGKIGIATGETYNEVAQILAGSIAQARQYADLIIVSPHWGANWKNTPTQERINLAHCIIDAGADLIIGHSAHILQGIEVYKNKPIIYDMGTILFDRISQDKMQYSAVFDFEFSKNGFTKLKVHPLRLQRGRVTLAAAADIEYINKLLKDLSQMPHSQVDFKDNQGVLTLDFKYYNSDHSPRKKLSPELIFNKKYLKKLPAHFLDRPNSAVVKPTISKLSYHNEIILNNGLKFIGSECPDQVNIGFGFLIKLYFKVQNPFVGHWELIVKAQKLDNVDVNFEYSHPITEGVYPVAMWKENDDICDAFVVRTPTATPIGIYQLSWKIYERNTKEHLFTSEGNSIQDYFYFGTIDISNNAPGGVAGLAY